MASSTAPTSKWPPRVVLTPISMLSKSMKTAIFSRSSLTVCPCRTNRARGRDSPRSRDRSSRHETPTACRQAPTRETAGVAAVRADARPLAGRRKPPADACSEPHCTGRGPTASSTEDAPPPRPGRPAARTTAVPGPAATAAAAPCHPCPVFRGCGGWASQGGLGADSSLTSTVGPRHSLSHSGVVMGAAGNQPWRQPCVQRLASIGSASSGWA